MCHSLLKCSLGIVNALIIACGITLITAGAVMLTAKISAGSFSIVVGIITTILGIMGLVTALKESGGLAATYVVGLFILLIFQVALGAVIFVWNDYGKLSTYIKDVFHRYWKDTKNKNRKKTVTFIQEFFKCCGIVSADDYLDRNLTVPDSCYSNGVLHTKSCYKEFNDFILYGVGLVAVIVIIIEFVGASAACILQNREEDVED